MSDSRGPTAANRLHSLAGTFDAEADHWRQKKKEAEMREIWFMNRASALREIADKADKIATDYATYMHEFAKGDT